MNLKSFASISALFLVGMAAASAWGEEGYSYAKRRESSDWCTISIRTKTTDGPDLPLVLLIGDSITVRYSAEVNAALKDKAYVSLLGTSKAVGDPALLDEIKLVLRQNAYAVVHFNYGLHGDVDGYREGFADVLTTLRRYAPGAKLIWATTTPRQRAGGEPDKVIQERNQIAAEHVSKAGILVDDLYSLTAKHPQGLWDAGGVHFTAEGTAIQSRQVAEIIAPLLRTP